MKSNSVLFYSSVKDVSLFELTGFYVEDIKALKEAGYNVTTTNNPFLFLLFWTYDVSFFYFYKKSLVPALFSLLAGKKIVYTGGIDELSVEVEISNKHRLISKTFFILNYFLADYCNIVSKEDWKNTTNLLKEIGIRNPKKLVYFPHSIDVFKFSKYNSFVKEDIITSICWMDSVANVKRKGVDATVRVFKNIVDKNKKYKLYIVGSWGPGKEYLDVIVKELDLQNNVFFTGPINDAEKIDLLSRSKFYFQLSKYEGFGIAVIEAMILHNYIFHTGKGGLLDTIGEKGCLINDTNNIEEIVREFEEVIRNDNNEDIMLIENANKVKELFSTLSRSNNFKTIIKNA